MMPSRDVSLFLKNFQQEKLTGKSYDVPLQSEKGKTYVWNEKHAVRRKGHIGIRAKAF